MKKTTKQVIAIIILAIALCFTDSLWAQNARVTSSGNYVAVKADPKVQEATNKTFTDDKGNVFPLYESKNGKLYYIKTSKAGKEYKAYLKLN